MISRSSFKPTLVVLAFLLAVGAAATSAVELPDTYAGERFEAFIKAFNSGDEEQ